MAELAEGNLTKTTRCRSLARKKHPSGWKSQTWLHRTRAEAAGSPETPRWDRSDRPGHLRVAGGRWAAGVTAARSEETPAGEMMTRPAEPWEPGLNSQRFPLRFSASLESYDAESHGRRSCCFRPRSFEFCLSAEQGCLVQSLCNHTQWLGNKCFVRGWFI